MNKYVENLRDTLNTALEDMGTFLTGVYNAIILNAPLIKEQYEGLGIALDSAIIDPWTAASEAIKKYQNGDGTNLGLAAMNDWTKEGGYFDKFSQSATNYVTSPWKAGQKAIGSFKESVDEQMANVVKSVNSNVSKAKKELKDLYDQIQDTPQLPTGNGGNPPGGDTPNDDPPVNPIPSSEDVKALQTVLNGVFNAGLEVDGKLGAKTTAAIKSAQQTINRHYKEKVVLPDGIYGSETRSAILRYVDDAIKTMKNNAPSSYIGQGVKKYTEYKKKLPTAFYAKGTRGTKRDEWAITDESWIGEEITLAAGKSGQLQYLKKGSAVMPADISANLVEWGKLNPNMLNMTHQASGVAIISNAVNKPEINVNFDSLVHVDHCDEGTLKGLERMVDNKINEFSKQMNYAIKRVGGR